MILTFQDLLDALVDYSGANPNPHWQRQSRRAARMALDELGQAHHWSYLYRHRFITTSAPQESSTITYDHTGGSSERLVTIASGTWPTWAADATLRIGNVNYEVAAYLSTTTLQLDVNSNPGQDVASGTSYTLFRDSYVLPTDLWTIDELYPEDLGPCSAVEFVHPREWLSRTRFDSSSSNYPTIYTVVGSADYQGAMELRLHPFPDSATTLAYIYSRRSRPVVFENESDGTVTNTAASATVTGSQSAFTSAMIGSIIRLASDASEEPTGREGANPFVVERTITAVASATSLTVDDTITDAHSSGVKYVISDPIDIDVGLMQRAPYRCAESQIGKLLRLEDRTALDAEYVRALMLAREADSRSTAMRAVDRSSYSRRLADYPGGDDED